MDFKKRIWDITFGILILLLLAYRLPGWLEDWRKEGQIAHQIQVLNLEEEPFTPQTLPLDSQNSAQLLIFWATWCGPCKVELQRINRLIESHKIPAERVLAISSYEDPQLVLKTAQERKYLFPVFADPQGDAAKIYKVKATPSLVLLSQKGVMEWVTSGLSPSLELRLMNAFDHKEE